MSNVNESISRIKELLDYPQENTPSLHRIYGALIRHIQHRFNELNNTGQAWAYATENVSAVSGTETYTLTSTNFGKPLSVVTYSTDDSHVQRQIPFFEVQNLAFDWDYPRNIASGFWQYYFEANSAHSANRVAFYRDAGTNTVKLMLRPIPQATATYQVLYSIGDWTDDVALTSTPLLSEHHSVFEIPAAIALLPSAKWGPDDEKNMVKRKMLSDSLRWELSMFEPSWTTYISEQTHSGIGFREVSY